MIIERDKAMFAFFRILALLIFVALQIVSASAAPCNQVDQLLQARCQIENAFQARNFSLVDTIFSKSTYADPNDLEVCSHHGYPQCAVGAQDARGFQILFEHGLSPDLAYLNGNYPTLAMIIDSVQNNDPFIIQVVKMYFDKGVDLNAPMPNTRDGGTLRHFILSKCSQSHERYPRYNQIIDLLLSYRGKITSDSDLIADLTDITSGVMGGGDAANCRAYLQALSH